MSKFELISLLLSVSSLGVSVLAIKIARVSQQSVDEKRRQCMISKVCEEYLNLCNDSRDSGISALFKSGISELSNENDAISVVDNIEKRTSKSALGKDTEKAIREYGILRFFQSTSWNEIKNKGGVLDTIEYLKNNMKD